MSSPLFTVVLCTRNRAALLPRALESLAALEVDPPTTELLIVDNGSTDATPTILSEFAARAPFFTLCLREERRGLSAARNRALREARGQLLFFTDDDQEVASNVLREHARVAEAHGARAQLGAIELRFEGDRPAWLRGPLAEVLGETRARPEGPSDLQLYGGNMVLERSLLTELGGFREDLGKGTIGYSEDTELTQRLRERGVPIVFAPTAVIYHLIEPDRTTGAFFRRTCRQKGASDGVLADPSRSLLGRVLRAGSELSREGLGGALGALRGDQHRWMLAQARIAYRLGWLGEVTRRSTILSALRKSQSA